ncbi:MAG: heat-inducible transcriptional repressor HrcA [Actinobacteria bacterium]|nr:heat-inducible transcriptional repressor HrcA [Actinomycetota bacterium]
MTDDRRLAVLRAIVEDFVATREPVGSKALVDRHQLGVSPATVRNDMAVLEEEGYIAAPHTSAGRIPTDKGYRLFVDRLASVKPLSAAERRAIASFLDDAVDLDDVMQRTVRLLAQLTHQVALIQYPSLTRSAVRHVELVPLSSTRMLMVLIADTGRVEQRMLDTATAFDEQFVSEVRAHLNSAVDGQRFADVPARVAELPSSFPESSRPNVAVIVATLLESVIERPDERILLSGTANLTKFGADFTRSVLPVLEALEEHVVLLNLLGQATSPDTLTVTIGHENSLESLSATSVVSIGYGGGGDALAQLGVVGPTHMDYPGTIASVRAVSRYVGRILADG